MRVLYVSDVYFPRVNGVSTSIRTFREDLAAHGVETVLVAPDYPGRGGSGDPGVVRVPSGAVPGDPEDRRMHWRALARTLDAIPHDAFDLVHVQTPFVAHYAGVRFARAHALPCVVTCHTFFEEYLHHYVPVLPRLLGRAMARAFTRSQCAAVQALIAPSEPMRATLVDAYGVVTPVHVVPTGLPADRYVRGDGARFRREAGIEPDRPVLTYVGRVAHEKNIAFLVHAFAAVRRRLPQALLVIAGEGPAREALQGLVRELALEDAVRFLGYLDRSGALLDCYAAADAFVFASRTETQGLVLLEAFAQGTPVVSTAELGTRSILVGDCGALVVPEDLEAFAAAALRILTEPALRVRLAREALAHARRWSSPAMASRLVDVYHSLVEAKESGAMPSASRRKFQVAGGSP